jgi:hypothetical protein
MPNRSLSALLSFAAIAGISILGPAAAHAELDACGGIFLAANSACEYRPKEECMTQCMAPTVEESCVTELYNDCETSCTVTASTECESSCTTTCTDDCTTTATTDKAPSCMELCVADCDGPGGEDACGSAGHKGPCSRCEKHNCDKRCHEKCGDDDSAPKKVTTVTECMPTCTNACSASCTAKANTQCQVDCQERTYTQCEQKMVEHCDTECKDKGGAIFCDGQFVNASNAQSCADELRAKLSIDIDVKASVSAAGNAASKTADKVSNKIDKACAVADVGARGTHEPLAALCSLTALGLWLAKRRRDRR